MTSSTHPTSVVPSEVGWQFVPQYYTFVNKEPHRLHCFYSKNSTFIHGTEGEDVKSYFGQQVTKPYICLNYPDSPSSQEIHKKISSIGFEDCKVFIHSVDAQSSANGGIIIQVIGEMSNHGEPWRKFVQTFFLAEQPNGYFVLNDIFRFLKEETVDDGEDSDAEVSDEAPVRPPSATPVTDTAAEPPVQLAAPVATEPVYEQPREATPAPPPPVVAEDALVAIIPEDAPKAAESTPEPAQAPASVSEQPTQTVQPNGHAPEPEIAVVLTPALAESSPKPSPPPVLSAPSPAPPQVTTTSVPTVSPPIATSTSQHRTWASLAASNSQKWGLVAQVSETVAPSSSPGSGSQPPAATAPTPAVGAAQPHHGRPNHQRNDHPALIAAQSVTTAHCFVKVCVEFICSGPGSDLY